MRLCTRMRNLCEEAGTTPRQIEELAGLGKDDLSRLIIGAHVPSLDELQRVAHELDVPLRSLFFADDEPPSSPRLTPRVTWDQLTEVSPKPRLLPGLLSLMRVLIRSAAGRWEAGEFWPSQSVKKDSPVRLCMMDSTEDS